MILRQIQAPDIKQVHDLQDLVSFEVNPVGRICDRIVCDGDAIIAYGIIKQFAEAVFLTDPTVSSFKRAKSLDLLMETAMVATAKVGLEQLHTFTKDARLAAMLEKHYGFVPTKDIVLVREV